MTFFKPELGRPIPEQSQAFQGGLDAGWVLSCARELATSGSAVPVAAETES